MKQRLNFLDGIRGWGAVTVLFYHVFVNAFPIPAGIVAPSTLHRFFMFNGILAVWIFFIVSAFAISHSFFMEKNSKQLRRILLSRYLRLALPILAISLIVVFGSYLNLIPAVLDRPEKFRHAFLKPVGILDGIRFALYDVFFAYDGETTLVPPLWTMQYELLGSLAILIVLPFLKKTILRYSVYGFAIALCYYYNVIYLAFIMGVIFAELYASPFRLSFKYTINISLVILILPILYLSSLLPTGSPFLYLLVATTFTFFFIFQNSCQAFFANAISSSLGRISFSLYLVHSPIFWMIGLKMHTYTYHFLINIMIITLSFTAACGFQKIDQLSQRIAHQFATAINKLLVTITNGFKKFGLKSSSSRSNYSTNIPES